MRALWVLVGLVFVVPGYSSPGLADIFRWLEKNVLDRVSVNGTQTFALHYHRVEGDEDAFRNQFYYYSQRGRFTDDRNLNIVGQNVLGYLNFNMSLDNHSLGRPYANRMSLNYERGAWKADLGDITASLGGGNELIRLTRTTRGGAVQYQSGGLTAKFLFTQTRGAVKTISLTGNNSPGPYYLQAGYILDGSVRVQVDGVEQRLGVDYVVNLDQGTITFLNRSIPPTSTIVVTYETIGPNQSQGDVYGGSVSYRLLPGVSLGVTMVEQRPRGSLGLRQTTEEFEGFGPPSSPYYLLFPPLRSQPIIVTVDGILQVEGVDYYFDAVNPQVFYFTRFMPPESLIRVTYTPTPDPGSFGNARRRVQGLDLQWKVGTLGQVQLSFAQSRAYTPAGSLSSEAMSARAQYQWGRLRGEGFWKRIPGDFIGVETRGFARNEQGGGASLRYDAGRGLTFQLTGQHLDVSAPRYTGTGIVQERGRVREVRFGAEYTRSETEKMFLRAESLSGRFAGNVNRSRGVSTGYRKEGRNWSVELGGVHQEVEVPNLSQQGQLERVSLTGIRVSGTYRLSERLTFSSQGGFNSIRKGEESGVGKDWLLRLEYRPAPQWEISGIWTDTNSGVLTNIGGFVGGGFGYNGNGFSGGSFSFGLNTGFTRQKALQLMARWSPSERLSVDASWIHTESEGDNVPNSKLQGFSVGVSWSPFKDGGLFGRFSLQEVSLVGSSGTSDTKILDLGYTQKFGKRWNVDLSYSTSDFGGSGLLGFGRTAQSLNGRVTYLVGNRQRLFGEYSRGNVNGYLPDRQVYLGLGYSYELAPGVDLAAVYRWRERVNLDVSTQRHNFRSSGIDIELRIAFGSRGRGGWR